MNKGDKSGYFNSISEIMENHSGILNILFSDKNVLLVFEWD